MPPSGLASVELTNIRRQNPALAKFIAERERIQQYRSAVEAARDGKLAQSFQGLDKLKAIEQCSVAEQHEKLAARYLELAKQHQSCVVVSQMVCHHFAWQERHQHFHRRQGGIARQHHALRGSPAGVGCRGGKQRCPDGRRPANPRIFAAARFPPSGGNQAFVKFNEHLTAGLGWLDYPCPIRSRRHPRRQSLQPPNRGQHIRWLLQSWSPKQTNNPASLPCFIAKNRLAEKMGVWPCQQLCQQRSG